MPSVATITVQKLGPNNAVADLIASLATYTLAGDAFAVQGREFLVVANSSTSGASCTVTVKSLADNYGQTLTGNDLTAIVATGKVAILGPLSPTLWKDPGGLAQVTYSSSSTGITVGLFSAAVLG